LGYFKPRFYSLFTRAIKPSLGLVKGRRLVNRPPRDLGFGRLRAPLWPLIGGIARQSFSHLEEVVRYIQDQEAHHRTKTFREEYLAFLQKQRIEYEEKYALG
jgi:hypothetical protein